MIIEKELQQGSEEWLLKRSIIPTASEFGKIITGTGKRSGQAEAYARECAYAEVTGNIPKNFTTKAMDRGHEMEPRARALYEFEKDCTVIEVGMVYANEFKRYSCSPDGLLLDVDGVLIKGLEIKCPEIENHLEYVMKGVLPNAYIPQVQGSMWVCGCDEWDFMSYHPDAKPLIITVKKDKLFHQDLERFMKDFQRMKAKFVKQIKEIMEK